MPKWVFNHTEGAFSFEDKHIIAQGMAKIYSAVGLPAFYANTQFFELPKDNLFTGGEIPDHAVTTLAIYHLARTFQSDEIQDYFFKAVDDLIRPIMKKNNTRWEIGIYEAPLEFWRMNGLRPPKQGSEMEKKWFDANTITDEEELLEKQERP
ncbi:unnamed protein product [Clonostachys rosea]|uniref:Tautomerase cis-CaaD-like domain-containing protein n=1 Tax=Bionectria ochroleuca TaxID=29856 RepID=A0ABY6UKY2_BIOOC|nr:unnamed protein product [Clonostachys rosea]